VFRNACTVQPKAWSAGGAELHERILVPAADARLAETRFDDWLNQSTIGNN
jgi:hypothetical protein